MKTGTHLKSSPFKLKQYSPLKITFNGFIRNRKQLKKFSIAEHTIMVNSIPILIWKSGKADSEFSKWIRSRDKKCLKCDSTEDLTNSHFHGRDHSGTRYHPENCDTLCKWCHGIWEYEKKPGQEYYEWKLKQLGEVRFKELGQLANTKVLRYDAIVECMKFLADNPINNLKEINI